MMEKMEQVKLDFVRETDLELGEYYRLSGFFSKDADGELQDSPNAWVVVRRVDELDIQRVLVLAVAPRYKARDSGWTAGLKYTYNQCWRSAEMLDRDEWKKIELLMEM